ncbi:hypothetical protein RW115_12015 [Macrococcus capreoli]
MLKVLFKNLPKEFQKITKLSNKQQYYISDVNDKFDELIEASEYELKKNGKYLEISFELLNENGIQAFIAEDYVVDGKVKNIQGIVKYLLDTQYVDESQYDNGMSNLEEDKEDLIKEINDSLDIKARKSSSTISRTKKPVLFKFMNFLHKKEEKNENDEGFLFGEENIIKEDVKNEENESIPTVKKLALDDSPQNEEVMKDALEETTYVPKTKIQSQTDDDEIVSHKKENDVEKTVENKDLEENNIPTSQNNGLSFEIPQFKKKTPLLSLPESDDFFSREVQEYLNLFEVEKTNVINNNIERINNSIINFVQEKTIEVEKELQKYIDLNKPKDDDLQKFKNTLMQKHMGLLENFKTNQTETLNNLISKKKEQHEIEIEKFKELKAAELEEYKISLERSHDKEFETEISKYRSIADEDIDRERLKLKTTFLDNVDAYNNELLTATKEATYALYQKHEQEIYPDVERFNKEITEEIKKIKTEINQLNLERQKEINRNEQLNNERLEKENIENKLKNESQALKLKEEEFESINKKKDILLLEKEKDERAIQERKLKLEEDKQEKEFQTKMKELELKYSVPNNENVITEKSIDSEKQNHKGIKGFAGGILASLLLGAGVYGGYNAYEDHQHSYSNLLGNKNYVAIAKEYPERLSTLSLELYKNREYDALEKLSKETNNPYVNFRRDLSTRNQARIIKSFESLNDYNLVTNEELEQVANIYIANNELDKAKDISKQLNNENLQKKIANQESLSKKKEAKEKDKKN